MMKVSKAAVLSKIEEIKLGMLDHKNTICVTYQKKGGHQGILNIIGKAGRIVRNCGWLTQTLSKTLEK